MIPDLTDRDEWPDEQLSQLRIAVLTEQERRNLLDTAEQQITDEQKRQIAAAMKARGLSKGELLALAQDVTGREVTGANDLTADEAALPLAAPVTYNGVLYEVLQPHTSAANWLPPDVASLYKPL